MRSLLKNWSQREKRTLSLIWGILLVLLMAYFAQTTPSPKLRKESSIPVHQTPETTVAQPSKAPISRAQGVKPVSLALDDSSGGKHIETSPETSPETSTPNPSLNPNPNLNTACPDGSHWTELSLDGGKTYQQLGCVSDTDDSLVAQPDGFGVCPAFTHYHNHLPGYEVSHSPSYPDLDGKCHDDETDQPIEDRRKLPKPKFHPDPKSLWL